MTRKKIPERTEVSCDGCKQICTPDNGKLAAVLKCIKGAFDCVGDVVGDGSYQLDLCDRCIYRVDAAIRNELKLIEIALEKEKPL